MAKRAVEAHRVPEGTRILLAQQFELAVSIVKWIGPASHLGNNLGEPQPRDISVTQGGNRSFKEGKGNGQAGAAGTGGVEAYGKNY